MTGPLALVINPIATRLTREFRGEAARALAPHGLEWVLVTKERGDAARLAREAVAMGAATVVALGGDGTVADVAGVMAGTPAAMAPLPAGNANVFARAVGWPNHPERALAVLTAALETGALRDVGLGALEYDGHARVFTINCGVGLDAATVEWIESRPRAKKRLRQAGFALAAGIATLRAHRSPRLQVEAAGEVVEALAVLVACGAPYTYLGTRPLDLVPGASFDGRLAWVALTRARPHEVTGLALRALGGASVPVGSGAVRGGDPGPGLVVRSAEPAPVQADGEPLGRHREVRVRPGPVLRMVDPALKTDGARTI